MPKDTPPEGHRDSTFQDMERLTVNTKDQLCIDGKPIEVQQVTLTRWQARIGIGTSVMIVLQALFNIANIICDWLA